MCKNAELCVCVCVCGNLLSGEQTSFTLLSSVAGLRINLTCNRLTVKNKQTNKKPSHLFTISHASGCLQMENEGLEKPSGLKLYTYLQE